MIIPSPVYLGERRAKKVPVPLGRLLNPSPLFQQVVISRMDRPRRAVAPCDKLRGSFYSSFSLPVSFSLRVRPPKISILVQYSLPFSLFVLSLCTSQPREYTERGQQERARARKKKGKRKIRESRERVQ